MHDSTSRTAHPSAESSSGSLRRRGAARRWLPAAIIAPAVVVAAAVAVPLSAGAAPSLPERSAAEILASIADSAGTPFSGTIEQTSSLGLPELPSTGGSDSASADGISGALELLTGSHELRVFVGGPDETRVQVLDTFAERNVIRNGSEVWTYDSEADEASHLTIPAHESGGAAVERTPADIAERLIASADGSSQITVDENARVAGRPVYRVTITPDTDDTLVASASLSVDAETGLPLAVAIDARGQDEPAFEIAFSSIDFSAPDGGLFDFTPPSGATVTEVQAPSAPPAADPTAPRRPDLSDPIVTGEGWATIAEIPAAEWQAQLESAAPTDLAAPEADASADPTQLLDQLTTQVAGGRALETSLVSVLLTDDGRLLVGAVPVDALVAAAAE